MPPLQAILRGHTLRDFVPRMKPRGQLALFLTLTFFLFCPLWAYLSVCGMHGSDDAGRDCFLYSFVFNMPVSLPYLAVVLAVLAALGLIADARQFPVFGPPIYRVLARAPPLY